MQTPAKNFVGRQDQSGRRNFLRAVLSGLVCTSVPALLAIPDLAHATTGKLWPLRRQTQLFMGTMVSITVAGVDNGFADDAMARAFALGRQLEAVYSRFDSGSPVSLLNRQGRLNDAPPALLELLAGAERISRVTGGLFDVTVLPLLWLAGQARNGSKPQTSGLDSVLLRDSGSVPAHDLKAASELVGYQKLVCRGGTVSLARNGMGITLDGIAKGHVANVMSDLLASLGCPNHLVNAGGDIVSAGFRGPGQAWRVGVADPLAPSRHLAVLDLPGKAALATSGIGLSEPAGRHLVRPDQGNQVSQTSSPASATVLAPDGLTADALATALCLLPAGDCLAMIDALPGCACCLVTRDGGIVRSGRWTNGGMATDGEA